MALANAQFNLKRAFTNFFKGRTKFPTFKSKKHKQSYTTNRVNENIKLLNGYIQFLKIKRVKIEQHRDIPTHHTIKSCTISKTKTGKYFVSILTEYVHQPTPKAVQAVVGLDFSMNTLYVDSESKKANDPRFYRQALEKLAKEQRILSRRKKGSHRWHKQRLKVAKLHEKIANQRTDFLHKVSCQLAKRYDFVVIEDLNMKGMSQALHFGKNVADQHGGCLRHFSDTN